MKLLSLKDIGLPLYDGLESSNEDLVYSYFRGAYSERGYSLKVKRSGYTEIDAIMRSGKTKMHGKGSCDAYVFSGGDFRTFSALIELESTGKLNVGIKQIEDYAKSFTVKTLKDELKYSVTQIERREILLVVYDGQLLWVAKYSLDTGKQQVIVDKIDVGKDRVGATAKFFKEFSEIAIRPQQIDEKNLVEHVANLIRGHEKFQKNKALVMTILASIFGATQELAYDAACKLLKASQDSYEAKIYDTLIKLKTDLGDDCDQLLSILYQLTAPSLYELSQDKGMDLYGYIYEELATKDSKKEQGEYYTPRHTIRPILASVQRQYLKWARSDLGKKIVLDPFCGSGGFLYEYIHLQKTIHGLAQSEVDDIAQKSLFGMDKSSILAAYLNLYLIGDGSANLEKVPTTINWRQESFLKLVNASNLRTQKAAIARVTSNKELGAMVKSRMGTLDFLLKLYSPIDINIKTKDLVDCAAANIADPIDELILSELIAQGFSGVTTSHFGKVDLLLTNVPYGKISNPIEQFTEGGRAIYGNSLEANALRECIDFLRPARMENGKITENGGVAVVIIPDSILENPSNKLIRDYLIARCEVLAIVGLPPFTFSPYAMEKTYALVFRKLAAEQFDIGRDISSLPVFMYYSLSDGKANSVNRFSTTHIVETEIKVLGGAKKKIVEFAHNDFEPCFDSYFDNKHVYLSKLERSWDSATWVLNSDWDQQRITEQWTGAGWKIEPGRKWGFFPLVREEREYRESVKAKSLGEKLEQALPIKKLFDNGEPIINFKDHQAVIDEISFSSKEQSILHSLSDAEIVYDDITDTYSLILYRLKKVTDVVLNPDDQRYLGEKRPARVIENVLAEIKMIAKFDEDEVVNFFRSAFSSKKLQGVKLSEKFDVIQGTQFSKLDAYKFPGNVPVYTAATDGPAYFCSKNILGKVSVKGPVLIWSRKGAKAGTIQLFDPQKAPLECYISDVSGAIKPKQGVTLDLTFMRYYIAGQVRAQIQAQDNNAQLNKSKLESLEIFSPADHQKIGDFLRSKGL